jgi:hypothetical protein
MKWFDRWFAKKLMQVIEQSNHPDAPVEAMSYYNGRLNHATTVKSISSGSGSLNGPISTNFTIYQASGGYVIEHSRYEREKDMPGPKLTIVGRDDDLATAIAHVITLEAFSN